MSLRRKLSRGGAIALLAAAACATTQKSAAPVEPTAVVPSAGPAPPPAKSAEEPPLRGTAKLLADLEKAGSITDRDVRWVKEKQLLERIRRSADPRGADALAAYLSSHAAWKRSGERVHLQTGVAFALVELGDLRSLPVLSERMRLDPLTVYAEDNGPEQRLRRDDRERVVAARLIADLATLHPEALAKIRAAAEEPLFRWITSKPTPHANGMRALAAMHSVKPAIVGRIRAWADPEEALPPVGAAPPMPEAWVVAQSALRYAGALRDAKTWPILLKQLGRRPAGFDGSMRGLMSGASAILGMSLRALGVGAASGLSEWGDPRAFDPLLRYIESDKENEQSRLQACWALGWVATKHDAPKLAKRISRLSRSAKTSDQFRLSCLLAALKQRRLPGVVPALLGLFSPRVAPEVRHGAARALGLPGVDARTERKLEKLLADPKLRADAALALLLGGSTDAARRAVTALPDGEVTGTLGELYYQSFGYFSDADLREGHLYRWVDNALALESLERPRPVQQFAGNILTHQLGILVFDNGPHSLTRVVLRYRLFNAASSGPPASRPKAVATLELMGERGTLLAIADGKGKTAELARAAAGRLPAPGEPR